MKNATIIIALLAAVGCGGQVDCPEPEAQPDPVEVFECDEPREITQANVVTPENSDYVWTGAGQPISYALVGTYVVEYSTGVGWECEFFASGCPVDLQNGDVFADVVLTVTGCPFSLTFTEVGSL